jgi:hypothetical protein
MSVTIDLKKRINNMTVIAPLVEIKAIVSSSDEEAAKDALWEYFLPVKDTETDVHDKQWLKNIVDWVPQGGLSLSEMAKWFKLVERVNKLDDNLEAGFTLSSFQVDLLWGRITDEKFKLNRLDSAFVEFILEFQAATGKHFEQEDPDGDE